MSIYPSVKFLPFIFPQIVLTSQTQFLTDSNIPFNLFQPAYETSNEIPTLDDIAKVLDRVNNYLESLTPAQI